MSIYKNIRAAILSNIVKPADRSIGIEIESIIYTKHDTRIPINSDHEYCAIKFVNIMNEKVGNNGNYSLEPGGQIEWSSKPYKDLNTLQKAIKKHNNLVSGNLKKNNLKLITYGVDPLFNPDDIDLIDLKKYQLMDRSMERSGSMGKWMMRCTSSIQVNFDVINPQELEEMVFIADCLHPVAAYLFANSPFQNGGKTNNKNLRNIIWENTDKSRCRNLLDHGINTSEDLINSYIDYILTVPSLFHIDSSGGIIEATQTIGERLYNLEKTGGLTRRHIDAALHQIFTNVRIKNLVEIRGADRTPEGYEITPAAFWTGLLTDKLIRKKTLNILEKWSKDDRKLFNHAANSLNILQPGPIKKSYGEWIQIFGDLALDGLKIRNLNEEKLFEEFFEIVIKDGPFSIQVQKNG